MLEGARTCLAETASRGSTAEEREAAVAWLEAGRDEHQVARAQASRRAGRGPDQGRCVAQAATALTVLAP